LSTVDRPLTPGVVDLLAKFADAERSDRGDRGRLDIEVVATSVGQHDGRT
jgi:hypothetical protein